MCTPPFNFKCEPSQQTNKIPRSRAHTSLATSRNYVTHTQRAYVTDPNVATAAFDFHWRKYYYVLTPLVHKTDVELSSKLPTSLLPWDLSIAIVTDHIYSVRTVCT